MIASNSMHYQLPVVKYQLCSVFMNQKERNIDHSFALDFAVLVAFFHQHIQWGLFTVPLTRKLILRKLLIYKTSMVSGIKIYYVFVKEGFSFIKSPKILMLIFVTNNKFCRLLRRRLIN